MRSACFCSLFWGHACEGTRLPGKHRGDCGLGLGSAVVMCVVSLEM